MRFNHIFFFFLGADSVTSLQERRQRRRKKVKSREMTKCASIHIKHIDEDRREPTFPSVFSCFIVPPLLLSPGFLCGRLAAVTFSCHNGYGVAS